METVQPAVCVQCGTESQTGTGYVRSPLTGTWRCARCAAAAKERRQKLTARLFGLLLVAAVVGTIVDLRSPVTLLLLGYVFLVMVGMIITVVHEAAHALVGGLVGFRVRTVTVGVGPRLVALSVLGVRVELRAYPLGGRTGYHPRGRATRTRSLMVAAAGPLSHLLMAWAVSRALPATEPWDDLRLVLVRLVLVLMVFNLVPLFGSDGQKIVQLLTMADAEIEGLMRGGEAGEAARRIQAAEAGRGTADPTDRQAFLDHLANPATTGVARAHSLNNLAVSDLLLEDPDLLAEADAASAEALELAPYEPAIRNTRGAVLVRVGHPDAGVPMLEETIDSLPLGLRGSSHLHLALGYAEIDRLFEARVHLARAERLDATGPLLRRARLEAGRREEPIITSNYLEGRTVEEAVVALRADARDLAPTIARSIREVLDQRGVGDLPIRRLTDLLSPPLPPR